MLETYTETTGHSDIILRQLRSNQLSHMDKSLTYYISNVATTPIAATATEQISSTAVVVTRTDVSLNISNSTVHHYFCYHIEGFELGRSHLVAGSDYRVWNLAMLTCSKSATTNWPASQAVNASIIEACQHAYTLACQCLFMSACMCFG